MNGGEEQSYADSRCVRDYFEALEYLEDLEYRDVSKVSEIHAISRASKICEQKREEQISTL